MKSLSWCNNSVSSHENNKFCVIFHVVSDISRLTPIKDQLPDHVDFNQIKMVIAILQRRFGLKDNTLEEDDGNTLNSISQSSMSKVLKDILWALFNINIPVYIKLGYHR